MSCQRDDTKASVKLLLSFENNAYSPALVKQAPAFQLIEQITISIYQSTRYLGCTDDNDGQ